MNLTYRSALCHSVGPSIVSSVRPSVRLLSNLCTRYFETDFDADWHKWSTGQGRAWNDQGVKDQGHMTPKYVEKIHFDIKKIQRILTIPGTHILQWDLDISPGHMPPDIFRLPNNFTHFYLV